MRSKLSLIIAMLVFVTGLAIYVRSAGGHPNKSFVVTFSYYKLGADFATSQIWIQKVQSSGRTATTKYRSIDGTLSPLSEDRNKWSPSAYSPEMWRNFSSPGFLKSIPGFVREDQICGFRVYVVRSDLGAEVVERWYSAETGPVPLKTIVEIQGEGTLVAEATNVEFRAVSDEELKQ